MSNCLRLILKPCLVIFPLFRYFVLVASVLINRRSSLALDISSLQNFRSSSLCILSLISHLAISFSQSLLSQIILFMFFGIKSCLWLDDLSLHRVSLLYRSRYYLSLLLVIQVVFISLLWTSRSRIRLSISRVLVY